MAVAAVNMVMEVPGVLKAPEGVALATLSRADWAFTGSALITRRPRP